MHQNNPENELRRHPGHSEKQVMDWGLLLASQGIEAAIHHGDGGWALLISERDFDRAEQLIRIYETENHGWGFRRTLPGSRIIFHWGSLFWCLAIAWIYPWSIQMEGARKAAGLMHNQFVASGEWWRIFTAVTLHGDLAHLAANLSTGFILTGLAMARHGAGWALGAAFLAGAGGNLAGLLIYDASHRGLGASGMVLGALGLASAQFHFTKSQLKASQVVLRSLAAGALLLVLMGTSPGTDIVAHVGGFLCGLALGFCLNLVPARMKESSTANGLWVLGLSAWVIWVWHLALKPIGSG